MASIKVKFRPSAADGRPGTIYYLVVHRARQRLISSPHKLFGREWDEKKMCVVVGRDSARSAVLLAMNTQILLDVSRLEGIANRLSREMIVFTADDIVDRFTQFMAEGRLTVFTAKVAESLKKNGRVRTSETYVAALSSFKKFLAADTSAHASESEPDIMLDCITAQTMQAYESWLYRQGVCPNTASFYNRILRAIYNRAVDAGLIDDRRPFGKVYTGIARTAKRALSLGQIRKIASLDLSEHPTLDFARDVFMLSFYLRGMSFVDMVFLKKSDVTGGYVAYRRRKTGQRLTIRWEEPMQRIIDKYPPNTSEYLLPIISSPVAEPRKAYRNMGCVVNAALKKVARVAGITTALTLYVARHSWASIAKAHGISTSVISESMGHDSEATTQIYLASLDTSVVDKANELIIGSISSQPKLLQGCRQRSSSV